MTPVDFDAKYPFHPLIDALVRRRGEVAAHEYLSSKRGILDRALHLEPVSLPETWRALVGRRSPEQSS